VVALVAAVAASGLLLVSAVDMSASSSTERQDPAGLVVANPSEIAEIDAAEATEGCEVCVYAVENKQQHQSYLCRGLANVVQQKMCVQVLESLMWWLTNEVYWINYGCQRQTDAGTTDWVRPCPAHVVCGWLEDLRTRKPFCTPDAAYPKPV